MSAIDAINKQLPDRRDHSQLAQSLNSSSNSVHELSCPNVNYEARLADRLHPVAGVFLDL